MSQNRMLKIWIWVGVAFFAAAVLCTFLARSIQTAMLPQVEISQPYRKTMGRELNTMGTITKPDDEVFSHPFSLDVAEVFVNEGWRVKEGTPLLRMDMTNYKLEAMQYELAILQLNNALARRPDARTRAELEAQLEITNKRYEQFLTRYPEDDVLYAPSDAVIEEIHAQEGHTYAGGAPLFTLAQDSNHVQVLITLSPRDYQIYIYRHAAVTLTYWDVSITGLAISTEKLQSRIAEVVFDAQTQRYLCYTRPEDIPLGVGQAIEIALTHNGIPYEHVVPRSAVHTREDRTFIYILETQNGLFGEENYVRELTVEIIDSNDYEYAIRIDEFMYNIQIVMTSTAPLNNGQTVAVIR